MLKNQEQYLTYMDEIALSSMIHRVSIILKKSTISEEQEQIGFAVAMDILPTEEITQSAVLTLLSLIK